MQHSTSPWASPVGICITVNYKMLHKLSILGQLPIPRVDEVLDKLGTSRIFYILAPRPPLFFSSDNSAKGHDTSHRFLHTLPSLRMADHATKKKRCSRVVHQRHQRIHQRPLPRRYLDDVIVLDADPILHVASMKEFFLRLRKHNLKLSPSKAAIGATDAHFLCHTIFPVGVMPKARKVEALMKCPSRKTKNRYSPFWVDFRITGNSCEIRQSGYCPSPPLSNKASSSSSLLPWKPLWGNFSPNCLHP